MAPDAPPPATRYERHVNPAHARYLSALGLLRVVHRASGTRVEDTDGKVYCDLTAGGGTAVLGHHHPRVVAAVRDALARAAPNNEEGVRRRLEDRLRYAAGDGYVVASLTSDEGEAIEQAIKLARLATGRTELVACEGAHHGLSLGALSLSTDDAQKAPVAPLLEGCHRVPYGDISALDKMLSHHPVAGFFIETVQVESGVRAPDEGYLREAQALCTDQGTLMIVDEARTSPARTGHLFACQGEGLTPDVLVASRSLGGGVTPLCGVLAMRRHVPEGHRERALAPSYLWSNTLACSAAIATLEVIEEQHLATRAFALGQRLLEGLTSKLGGSPLLRGIRGRGLLVALDLVPPLPPAAARLLPVDPGRVAAAFVQRKMLDQGFAIATTGIESAMLLLEPALTIEEADIDASIDALARALEPHATPGDLLKQATRSMGLRARHALL